MIRLIEGTHYDTNAVSNLIKAGWDEDLATNLIDELYKQKKIKAFNYCPNFLIM